MNGKAGPLGALVCHPGSRPVAARAVQAGAARLADGSLALRFVLAGDMAGIAVPAARGQNRIDGLWRHTCFECFVAAEGRRYLEFNFSPARAWAAYAFRDYRDAAALPAAFDPHIAVTRAADRLALEAMIPSAALPPATDRRWRVGLTAVVEETSGTCTYWALRHAAGKPDFHHAETFALEL